jgi:hypothetical protein
VINELMLGIAFVVASGASGGPTGNGPHLSISQPDTSPVRIQSATIEPGSSSGLRLRYVVANLKQQNIEHLIVTAATVDGEQRVTSVQVQTIEERIGGGGRKEQFVVFPGLLPASGEHVVFGVLAVGWSGGQEWRGVVRLAARTTASD